MAEGSGGTLMVDVLNGEYAANVTPMQRMTCDFFNFGRQKDPD